MNKCKECGSYAINLNRDGRDESEQDLCDVCYWRQRAAAAETIIARLQAIVDPLNRLRQDEGNSVTFICPNPDFNELPDEAIEVSADWTGWEPRRFSGRTLAECLAAAEKARAE